MEAAVLINFLIVSCIITFVLFKLKVKRKLSDVANEIKNYVETAENEKKDSEKRLDIINGKIQRLPDVIERIKKSTENNIKNSEKNLKEDIEEEKNDISKNAQRHLRLETGNFKNKLISFLSEKSIEAAAENAKKQLKNNPKLHRVYINKAIEELDRINL